MSEKQIIISIGREYGSGGHAIAEKIAKNRNLPLYDYNILQSIADEKDVNISNFEKYDEVPKIPFMSRTVRGFSNAPQENLAQMQFDFLKEKAGKGESFVVVGRCSEMVLKEFDCMIPIFVLGDMEAKIERIMRVRNVSKEKAVKMIKTHDRMRKSYHNYYCEGKWGDSRNYEMSINSSKIGLDGTVAMIEAYIEKR